MSSATRRLLQISTLIWVFTAASAAEPECASVAHDEFDFWVGTWEVARPDGTPAGTSHVERILAGCVIFENWESASGNYAGKSFNTFDPGTGRWNQVWVDTTGATIHFSGRRRGKVMTLTGTQRSGRKLLHNRMTYALNDDGTVRQHWQQSEDRRNWETVFDGLYRRRTGMAQR